MMTISVARALAEHKLIEKKIVRLMASAKYCTFKRGRKNETGTGISVEEFTTNAKANYDRIKSLLKQKNALKSAIVESNAVTVVTIGKETMTVAAAIERKRSIELDTKVMEMMKLDYVKTKTFVEAENIKVQSKLDQLLEQNFGASKTGAVKSEDVNAISTPYLENNQIVLIDELKLESKISEMEEAIENFNKDVDFVLNESNVRREITVDIEA